jgi:hypothetical protein
MWNYQTAKHARNVKCINTATAIVSAPTGRHKALCFIMNKRREAQLRQAHEDLVADPDTMEQMKMDVLGQNWDGHTLVH